MDGFGEDRSAQGLDIEVSEGWVQLVGPRFEVRLTHQPQDKLTLILLVFPVMSLSPLSSLLGGRRFRESQRCLGKRNDLTELQFLLDHFLYAVSFLVFRS